MTDAQVRRLREKRMEGKTVSAAAAAAGMGELRPGLGRLVERGDPVGLGLAFVAGGHLLVQIPEQRLGIGEGGRGNVYRARDSK